MSKGTQMSAQQVFKAIVNEWDSRAADFEQLIRRTQLELKKWKRGEAGRRKWSFELDLNKWAREGCRKIRGWESAESSGLRAYEGTNQSADAFVTVPGYIPVRVEIA